MRLNCDENLWDPASYNTKQLCLVLCLLSSGREFGSWCRALGTLRCWNDTWPLSTYTTLQFSPQDFSDDSSQFRNGCDQPWEWITAVYRLCGWLLPVVSPAKKKGYFFFCKLHQQSISVLQRILCWHHALLTHVSRPTSAEWNGYYLCFLPQTPTIAYQPLSRDKSMWFIDAFKWHILIFQIILTSDILNISWTIWKTLLQC